MKLVRSIPYVALLITLVASCSHAPRLSRDAEETADLRAEYLNHNPESPYKDNILKGEVCKGMNIMQVLASWGVPSVKRSYKGTDSEHWTYYTQDPYTEKVVSYQLVFDDGLLSRWVLDDDGELGTLTPEDLAGTGGAGGTTGSTTTPQDKPPAGSANKK